MPQLECAIPGSFKGKRRRHRRVRGARLCATAEPGQVPGSSSSVSPGSEWVKHCKPTPAGSLRSLHRGRAARPARTGAALLQRWADGAGRAGGRSPACGVSDALQDRISTSERGFGDRLSRWRGAAAARPPSSPWLQLPTPSRGRLPASPPRAAEEHPSPAAGTPSPPEAQSGAATRAGYL